MPPFPSSGTDGCCLLLLSQSTFGGSTACGSRRTHSWRSVLCPSCSDHVCAVALGGACSIDTAVVLATAASASWSAAGPCHSQPKGSPAGISPRTRAEFLQERASPAAGGRCSDLHLCHGVEGGRSKHNKSGGAASLASCLS